MNVNKNDWKLEMHRVLEVFEQESTSSLRKINRCFTALGRPFDEDFRQYYLKMSTLRLDSSFNTILFEQLNESRMQTTSTTGTPNNANGIGSNLHLSSPKSDSGLLNASERGSTMELETENNADATVEITDSDDDNNEDYSGRREANDTSDDELQSNTAQNNAETNDIAGSVQDVIDSNVESDVEIQEKCELRNESEDEMMVLPLEVFDPNQANDSTGEKNCFATLTESIDDQNQPSTSSNAEKQTKQHDGKRFKCKKCAYTARYKSEFKRHQLIHKGLKPFKCEHCRYAARLKQHLTAHQRMHNHQKLMGVVKDPSTELCKCPHCDQRFILWRGLRKHLTQTHKKNQRLFNCGRCMRRFTRKSEKERHELRCKNRLYECYLCKTYVAKNVFNIQQHMRTHSGAKPFECAICNKSFRQRSGLKYHLDAIHGRIHK